MQTAFIQSEILLALEGAAELDVLYQNYRMATAIITSLEHHILYWRMFDSWTAIDIICLIMTIKRSRIIFYSSITLAITSDEREKFQQYSSYELNMDMQQQFSVICSN